MHVVAEVFLAIVFLDSYDGSTEILMKVDVEALTMNLKNAQITNTLFVKILEALDTLLYSFIC